MCVISAMCVMCVSVCVRIDMMPWLTACGNPLSNLRTKNFGILFVHVLKAKKSKTLTTGESEEQLPEHSIAQLLPKDGVRGQVLTMQMMDLRYCDTLRGRNHSWKKKTVS